MRKVITYQPFNSLTHISCISLALAAQLNPLRTASRQAQRNTGYSIAFPFHPSKPLLRLGARGISTLNGDQSTIFALSTAPGRAAIAVIRVSGPQCLEVRMASSDLSNLTFCVGIQCSLSQNLSAKTTMCIIKDAL